MNLEAKTRAAVLKEIGPKIGSLGAGMAVAAGAAILAKLVGINMKTSTMAGDVGMRPTDNDAPLNKTEASMKDTNASLGKDEVKLKDGDLAATQTDAQAMTTDAKAMDSGASAAQPKAGALDVKTKGMVMS